MRTERCCDEGRCTEPSPNKQAVKTKLKNTSSSIKPSSNISRKICPQILQKQPAAEPICSRSANIFKLFFVFLLFLVGLVFLFFPSQRKPVDLQPAEPDPPRALQPNPVFLFSRFLLTEASTWWSVGRKASEWRFGCTNISSCVQVCSGSGWLTESVRSLSGFVLTQRQTYQASSRPFARLSGCKHNQTLSKEPQSFFGSVLYSTFIGTSI